MEVLSMPCWPDEAIISAASIIYREMMVSFLNAILQTGYTSALNVTGSTLFCQYIHAPVRLIQ
jgi:hypothetical protein